MTEQIISHYRGKLVIGVSVSGCLPCVSEVLKGRSLWCFCCIILFIYFFLFDWFTSLLTHPTSGGKCEHLINKSDRNYVNVGMWKVASNTLNCGTLTTHIEISFQQHIL